MSLGKRLINTGGVAACTTDSTDPFGDSSGVALYNLDYDASTAPDGTDYSGTPTDVTFGVGGQINYGARFNGSSSKVTTSLDFDTLTDYTISMWIKIDASPSARDFFAGTLDSSAKNGIYLANNTDETIRFYERNASGDTMTITSTDTINIGSWNHIVAVRDGNTDYLYINNGTPVSASNSTITHATGFTFGIAGAYATYFDGDIDQVRIFSSALTSDQVEDLYEETACVYTSTTDIVNYPTGTTPVAYYKLDNSSEDFSTGGNDGTDTNIEYRFGRFGQAAVFNGSSSYIDTGISSLSTFSVSMWLNETSIASGGFFGNWNGTANDDMFWLTDNSSGALRINFDGAGTQYFGTAGDFTINTWHHVVVTHSSGSINVYLDGSNIGSTTTSNTTFSSGANFYIGDDNSGTYFDGLIDQVRIYSTALSSSQVTELYNEKPETDTSTFKTVLYTGDGGTQYISNVGFQPDLVWVKNRDVAVNHYLYDSIRGTGAAKALHSNTTASESSASTYSVNGGVQSIDTNGFTVFEGTDGTYQGTNKSGNDYVAWCWKGGGDDVLNEVGDIDSQVSANTGAGFSIVKYTGNGISASLQKVGTGLNQECDFVVIKNLDNTASWVVQTNKTDVDKYLYLNDSRAESTSTAFKVDINTNEGTFGFTSNNAGVNALNNDYVAYCFHSVSGVSKIGSYNGDTSTVTVTTGFKPSFVMIKRTNQTRDWILFDTVRSGGTSMDDYLTPNSSIAEVANSSIVVNATSTGFTIASGLWAGVNENGGEYLYMAFK